MRPRNDEIQNVKDEVPLLKSRTVTKYCDILQGEGLIEYNYKNNVMKMVKRIRC